MLRRFPGRFELLFLTAVAVACAVIVKFSAKHDYALLVLSIPVFFVAAMMGLKRSGDLTRAAEPAADDADEL